MENRSCSGGTRGFIVCVVFDIEVVCEWLGEIPLHQLVADQPLLDEVSNE